MLNRRGFLRTAGAVGLGGAFASACAPGEQDAEGATTFAEAKQTGKIKVGYAGEEPYAFLDAQGRLTGEGPEVARRVLAKHGITELEGVLVDFRHLITELRAGRYAFVVAGMFITDARCAEAAFSRADYQVESAFLVRKGNPKGIEDFADVTDRGDALVAIMTGAVEVDYAAQAGVPERQIVKLSDQDSVLRAVQYGLVDAATFLDTTAEWLLTKHPELGRDLQKSAPFLPSGQPGVGAFTFRPGDEEFVAAFDDGLTELKESGEWLRVAGEFGFTAEHDAPDVRRCGQG